uniref:Uncharacterized protein n=1 Tax=viral metagenome TaxID=1070528 RepID=A0A6M3XKQ5_9ZZZZ
MIEAIKEFEKVTNCRNIPKKSVSEKIEEVEKYRDFLIKYYTGEAGIDINAEEDWFILND